MGRTPAFRQDAPLFTAIQNCPVLSRVKLIAEPWDIGEGGYQVGNFPPPFAEWNDHFRDAIRRFWLQRVVGEFAGRFAASSDRLNAMVANPSRDGQSGDCARRFYAARLRLFQINTMKRTVKKIATELTITIALIMVREGLGGTLDCR